jgi:hypothetical protein
MGLSMGRTNAPKVDWDGLRNVRKKLELDRQRMIEEARLAQAKTLHLALLAEAKKDLNAALSEVEQAHGAVQSAWVKNEPSAISTAHGKLGDALGRLGRAISRLSQLGG